MKKTTIIDTRFNGEYFDYLEDFLRESPGCEPSESLVWQCYQESVSESLEENRFLLDRDMDGVIVAMVDAGFWNGRRDAFCSFGSNLADLLSCGRSIDDISLFVDQYDARAEQYHHDGVHRLLYRLAPSKMVAERMADLMARGELTEERFRRMTKSLRPALNDIYGWTPKRKEAAAAAQAA